MKVIETLRLLLRRPMKADAIVLSNLWRNELVRAFLGGVLPDENVIPLIIGPCKIRVLRVKYASRRAG